jgi:rfaE bifunctional protein kinase chain/domain
VRKEKERLLKIIDDFSHKSVAVWGDLILDEYLYGTTRRISREAPVLIISYRNKEFALGGGGNSLLNLKALGAHPVPVGVIGSDEAGKRIIRILKQLRVATDYVLTEKTFHTPIKTRILAGEESTRKQQILRIDKDAKVPETKDLKRRLLISIEKAHKSSDALLISDYNYFTVKEDLFRKILPGIKKSKKPVALDSRFRSTDFKGVTVLTPNEPEVENALHIELDDEDEMVRKAGRQLLNRADAEAVLITRGSKGMVLFERRRPAFEIPIYGSTNIVDVTGAGDTVISVFTLALACGASFKQAAILANFAGGVVVMKKGTATLSPQELKEAVVS